MKRARLSRHTPFFEVIEALAQPGCCVCRLVERRVVRLLESFTYEQINDIEVRDELRAARGFCAHHARQYVRMPGTVLGAAIVYADVLAAIRRELADETGSRRGGEADGLLGGFLRTGRRRSGQHRRGCLACREAADAARGYLNLILEHLRDADFRERYLRSGGLCLPHLEVALDRARPEPAETLLQAANRQIDAIVRDLSEVVRKHDYRFNRERIDDPEATAASRAVDLVAGGPAS